MSRLLCLKHVALAVSVPPVHAGPPPAVLQDSQRSFFLGVNQQLSLSHSFSVRLTSLKVLPTRADSRLTTAPIQKSKDPLRTSDALPFLGLKYIYILMDSLTPPLPLPHVIFFYFFRICMDYTLCVPHFCVKLENTKQKR